MSRYHLNPKTGMPGVCRAKTSCPFGDMEKDHYASATEAQAAFEQSMTGNLIRPNLKLTPQNTELSLSNILDLEELNRDIHEGFIGVRPHDEDEALKILCYTKATQFSGHWTESTKVARGLIIQAEEDDLSDAVVLQRPWRKFFTLEQLNDNSWVLGDEEREGDSVEAELAAIDFNAPVEVTDKMDGSLGILYEAPDGLPGLATKGSFGSDQANYYTKMPRRNPRLLEEATALIEHEGANTFLFELVGKDNRIVLDYDDEKIALLGAVEKETGKYLSSQDYLDKWSDGATELMPAKTIGEAFAIPDRENREGVVIRILSDDPNKQMQLKVKQDDYKQLHRILTNFSISDMRLSVRESPSNFGDLLNAATSGDITLLPGVEKTFNIESNHPAVGPVMAERKKLLESVALPRLKRLKAAKDYVDALPESDITGPNAAKAFAQSISGVRDIEKGDLFTFFQARASGRDISSISAKKVLGGLARDITDGNLNRDE